MNRTAFFVLCLLVTISGAFAYQVGNYPYEAKMSDDAEFGGAPAQVNWTNLAGSNFAYNNVTKANGTRSIGLTNASSTMKLNFTPYVVNDYNISFKSYATTVTGKSGLFALADFNANDFQFGIRDVSCNGYWSYYTSAIGSWVCSSVPINLSNWQTHLITLNNSGWSWRVDGVLIVNRADRSANYLKNLLFSNGAAPPTFYIDDLIVWNATTIEDQEKKLTLSVSDHNTGAAIPGFCVLATGTNTSFNKCNATGTELIINTTGTYNITFYNITVGNASPVYFNVTIPNYAWSSTGTLGASTSQALIIANAYRRYLNTSIAAFNITNGAATNTSGAGQYIAARSGQNNVTVAVLGNYSINGSCVVTAVLSVVSCNITGVYDAILNVGAKNVSAGLTVFYVNLTNSALGISEYNLTTSGVVSYPILANYTYYASVNNASFSISYGNTTTAAGVNVLNISMVTLNTFNITFYNESTNTRLWAVPVYFSVISPSFAQNYSATNGTAEITLLTPDDYQIIYYTEANAPREYYVTLTPQSYNNLRLYTLDEGISSLYVAVIIDQDTRKIPNATVSLLRYYTENNGYNVVEMARTDSNGNAVFRVVPNIINYKLFIQKEAHSLFTDPSKFTAATNTYTLLTTEEILESFTGIQTVTKTLTFNNATNTYVLSWADSTNLVTGACLKVTKDTRTAPTSTVYYSCGSGATGSLIYSVTDTNATYYVGTGLLNTSTTYSEYSVGPVFADFLSDSAPWGVFGAVITLLIFLAFVFFAESGGAETMVLAGVFALAVAAIFGLLPGGWGTVIGLFVLAGIIMYRSRT